MENSLIHRAKINGTWYVGYLVPNYFGKLNVLFSDKRLIQIVDEKTISQFIGIFDINNLPIFVGDIVEINLDGQYIRYQIKSIKDNKDKNIITWDKISTNTYENIDMFSYLLKENRYIQIVGNIYDNENKNNEHLILNMFKYLTKDIQNRSRVDGFKIEERWNLSNRICLKFEKFGGNKQYFTGCMKATLLKIERILCQIANKDFEKIQSITNLPNLPLIDTNPNNSGYGALYDSEFFTFRIYKNGAIHMKFKDSCLLAKLNSIVQSNWDQL